MTSKLMIGPHDHGKRFTLEERQSAEYAEGYRYEIIDERLYVSPLPNLPAGWFEDWVLDLLKACAQGCPEVTNYARAGTRVFIPNRPPETVPEPDLAAYHNFSRQLTPDELDWRNVSPILVVEVLSEDEGEERDLGRNSELYRQVRSIRDYWLLDTLAIAAEPTLVVHRRQRRRWERLPDVPGGGTYATRLLPGFTLTLNTRD